MTQLEGNVIIVLLLLICLFVSICLLAKVFVCVCVYEFDISQQPALLLSHSQLTVVRAVNQ